MRIFIFIFFFIYLFAGEKIVIQLNAPYQFKFAGFIMAKEKGFYKEKGLDVQLRDTNYHTNVVKYILKTPNSYGTTDSSIMSCILEQKPINLLMPIYNKSYYVLTAINLPEVKTLKDILKYNIKIDKLALKHPSILAMIKSQNIDINKLSVITEKFHSLSQKGVFFMNESVDIYKIKKHHIPYTVFRPSDYGFDFYGDIFFTSKREVNLHPDRVRKIIEATKEGYIYAFNHIDETIDIIFHKYNPRHYSKEQLEYSANYLKDKLSKNFKFNMAKLQNIKNIYVLLGEKNNSNIFDYVYDPLHLTKLERDFIQNHVIRAISTGSWEPFNITQKGRLEGIAVSYWHYITQKVHLKTQCTITNNWSEVLNSIKNKNSDITCSTTKTKDREKYALFSKPYVSFPIVLATRNDVGFINDISLLDNKIIAVGKNYTAEKLLKKHYPNLKLLEVKNTDEALKLVSEGKVFGAVDILPVIAYKINKYDYANLKISGRTPFTFNVRFMIRKDYPELVSIINKVIDAMPKEKKQEIYRQWISVQMQQGYGDSYIRNLLILIFVIIFIVGIIIFILVRNNMKSNKEKNQFETLATMDKLTSIFNRYKIDMALSEQIEICNRYERPLSVMFFDIDHFKKVNDTYGHKVGDDILIEISKLINKHIRKSDIFGRWGGEEFLIILPETSLDKAVMLAEKLRKIVQDHKFSEVEHITISIGVTNYKKNDTLNSLMMRVDELLYKSKKNGRNQVTFG